MKQKLSSKHFCPAKVDSAVQHVGLYFGSFNPVHIGHVSLAKWVLEHTNLQELWMVVSPQNPFKVNQTLYPNEERFNWVQMAVEDIPGIVACNAEFFLPQPSYTIDTLRELTQKFPHIHFTVIMGADNVMGFSAWKDYQEILQKVAILVYPRPGVDILDEIKKYPSMRLLEEVPLFPISSTQIRELKAQGKDVSAYLPAAVAAVYS
ncbi:MAG: nicotinate (nicotinamide) nucleotide adenylyltransferase [Paludibacteraceae bacterium]|nr:nicotinate (nicotinamide) nucleotide adenylyltransferase [Paludibacteraceae bacterium]